MNPLPGSRIRVADLFAEAVASLRIGLFRSFLLSAGTVLAAAGLVITSGIATTLSHQVTAEFDAVRATEVTVGPAAGARPGAWAQAADLDRLRAVPGVVHAGVMLAPTSFTVWRPPLASRREVKVRQVDEAIIRILRPRIAAGTAFSGYHVKAHSPVIMLSRSVAATLEIGWPGGVVELGGRRLTVIGIYDDTERTSETLVEALVPLGVLAPPADATAQVFIETAPGAARSVAADAALALHPEDPRALLSSSPPDPTSFRRGIEGNVASLSFGVILVAFLVGAISIASTATASVHARTSEIGLRAVMGARPRHIFAQLLMETMLLGGIGGLLGSITGLTVVIAVCAWNGWMPAIDTGPTVLAVAASALSGLVAGLPPAWRAMRLHPADALRR